MALRAIGGENLDVSTTAVGITASLITTKVLMVRAVHKSGGGLHHNAASTPTAAGVTGDQPMDINDEIEVWGAPDLLGIKWVKRTGEADAVVAIQTFGEG